ncbi:MAG: tRNA (adenosine(37)-N6)-dimethylallyltransferase MiaA [Gammaproteobacteria bacterium]
MHVEAPLVFIMGPTGAGKTALALEIAARLAAEVVSVDSAQVYRGLDLGTAKPSPAVRARVPHHLLDICAPDEAYSAARFREDAQRAIAAVRARGRLPLLVGGTGLYFRALEQGLAVLPPADPAVRALLAAELERDGAAALHARLAALDAQAAARIHPNDPQRLLRALEVHELCGASLTSLWAAAQLAPHAGEIVKLVIAPNDRADLHRDLATRYHGMLDRGLVNEVRALRANPRLTAQAPAMRSVGYREVWRYLDGTCTRAEMIERGIVATRQLAKRQLTWFRRENGALWLDSRDPARLDRALVRIAQAGRFPARGI